MNGLSWLIYLADVADEINGLGAAAIAVAVVACIGAGIATGMGVIMSADSYKDEDEGKPLRSFAAKGLKAVLPWCAIFIIAAVVVPSKETVYAIAASEMGEQVVTSPTGQKAVRALEAWLDRQIAPAPAAE